MFKILVVDDSNSARKRVVNTIEKLDIKFELVDTACDGKEGLDCYIKHRPNLVFTDIEMPNMNGKEFIEKLKQLNKELPIIAITSIVNEKIKQSLMKHHHVYVLHKPIDIKLLNVLINKLQNEIEF